MAGIAALPWILWRRFSNKRPVAAIRERFTGQVHVADCPKSHRRIWLHGVSVGEVQLIRALVNELKPFAKKSKFYWCQEEPKNMGAWFSVRDYIQWTLDNIKANNNKISYIGRSPDASPATGYAKRHVSQQQEILKKVFE